MKSTKEINLFVSLALFSLFFVFLDKSGWLDWLKRPTEALSNLVREKTYQKRKIIKLFVDEENEGLKEKIDFLEIENADLRAKLDVLEQENYSQQG